MNAIQKARKEQPAFTSADLGGTIDCDLTGWLPVTLDAAGRTEQWGVTLIAGLRHNPAIALWGVAQWPAIQQPVCCFTAPIDSTTTQLTDAAAHALTTPGRSSPGRGSAHRTSRS